MSDFEIIRIPEFKKDLKKLKKRFPTLEEDLKIMLNTQLKLTHILNHDNKGTFPIKGLGIDGQVFYKIKKFSCMSLKGKGSGSGLRVIYTKIEKRIELIEIYYKQDKENEDRERIKKHYK